MGTLMQTDEQVRAARRSFGTDEVQGSGSEPPVGRGRTTWKRRPSSGAISVELRGLGTEALPSAATSTNGHGARLLGLRRPHHAT